MSRKAKYSREMVLEAAIEVFKAQGYEQITVKNVAKQLGSSIAPVYAAYTSMDDLKKDVVSRIESSLDEYAVEENKANDSDTQNTFFKRMFTALAPEDKLLQKEFETLVSKAMEENKGVEKTRLELFQMFMKAISLVQENNPKKLSRGDILSLIARHKRYILEWRKERLQKKKKR